MTIQELQDRLNETANRFIDAQDDAMDAFDKFIEAQNQVLDREAHE